MPTVILIVLGFALGVCLTNSYWVHMAVDRVGLLVLSALIVILGISVAEINKGEM